MSFNRDPAINTCRTLIMSTAEHVSNKIDNLSSKDAYLTAINKTLSILDNSCESNIFETIEKICQLQFEADTLYQWSIKDPFFQRKNYFLLGCAHVEDVMFSISKRFVN